MRKEETPDMDSELTQLLRKLTARNPQHELLQYMYKPYRECAARFGGATINEMIINYMRAIREALGKTPASS